MRGPLLLNIILFLTPTQTSFTIEEGKGEKEIWRQNWTLAEQSKRFSIFILSAFFFPFPLLPFACSYSILFNLFPSHDNRTLSYLGFFLTVCDSHLFEILIEMFYMCVPIKEFERKKKKKTSSVFFICFLRFGYLFIWIRNNLGKYHVSFLFIQPFFV